MVTLIVCSHPFAASSVTHQQVINVKICVFKSTCVAPNSLAIFLGHTRGSAFQIVSGTLNIARRTIVAVFLRFLNSLDYQVLPLPLPLVFGRLNVFPGGIWPSTCHFGLPAWYHCSQTPHSIRSIAWGGCRKIAIPHTFHTLHTHTQTHS